MATSISFSILKHKSIVRNWEKTGKMLQKTQTDFYDGGSLALVTGFLD